MFKRLTSIVATPVHAPVGRSDGSLGAALPLARPADTLVVAGGILDDMQRIFNVVSAVVKHPAAYPPIKVAGATVSIYQTGGRTRNIQN